MNTQLLRKCTGNNGDFDSRYAEEVGRVYLLNRGVDLLLISFLCQSTRLLLVCVLNGTSCTTLLSSVASLRSPVPRVYMKQNA